MKAVTGEIPSDRTYTTRLGTVPQMDISRNGIIEPIVFLDGAVLDGRNRYTVARELGIEYPPTLL